MIEEKQPQRKGKSPYVKYNKAPFIYSPTYENWKRAVMRGDNRAARQYSAEHRRQFHMPPPERYQ